MPGTAPSHDDRLVARLRPTSCDRSITRLSPCRDSILAAPLVLDRALFLDLLQRVGMSGIQEWLSFYFKAPQVKPGLYPEHDLFIQLKKLKNTLPWMANEDQHPPRARSTTPRSTA